LKYKTVILPPGSELPVRTAAEELADRTGAEIIGRPLPGKVGAGEIVLALGREIESFPEARELYKNSSLEGEWELVKASRGGLIIAGSTPRNVCRAALAWLADPGQERGRFSRYRFLERFTMWDNTLNQWYRFTRGFDRRQHIRELARMGHTGVEINRCADEFGWHVRNRRFPNDSYAWYVSYAPALDAFVESSLTKGLYPAEELQRNMADLEEAAEIARSYGLKPGFVSYEPRCVNEKIFDKYPQLRGSRTDHPGRSLVPRYALDIAHPRVLEHYAEMLTNLMKTVPDLRYLVFWTGDSGSGLPFASDLYFGPNGSYLARSKKLEQMAAEFSGSLLEAGRKINPEFEVLMEIGWEYTKKERERITAALPEGVTLTHPVGAGASGILGGQTAGSAQEFIAYDRAHGKEPYGEIVVSTWWDIEPVYGIPFPTLLATKFETLKGLDLERFFTRGGIVSPPQCPYNINHELYSELIRDGEIKDLHGFLLTRAKAWCDGDERLAELLVKAWLNGERALKSWPVVNWYHPGPCTTQGRWLTRPLVPDFSSLSDRERAAFDRSVFTLEWDIARLNLAFEGGIRMYREEDFERAVKAYDNSMLPMLELTVGILEQALNRGRKKIIEDQRDRYKGLLLLMRTVRNSFASQAAINRYLLKEGDREQKRRELDQAIQAEIANTREWLELLRSSRTNFFHIAEREETPFVYKTPVEDLVLRLEVMERHRGDEPGPDLAELRSRNDEGTLWQEED
jgi:hypothetical protein